MSQSVESIGIQGALTVPGNTFKPVWNLVPDANYRPSRAELWAFLRTRVRSWHTRSKYYWQKLIISPLFLTATLFIFVLIPDDIIKERLVIGVRRLIRNMIRRSFEIGLSLSGILVSLPFFILIPILIRLDSPGPIIYRQLRIGKNRRRGDDWGSRLIYQSSPHNFDRRKSNCYGQPFYLYKFRTMYQDAELKTGPVWATRKDPRVTRIGRILRATHLDELPQFYNVLIGEMGIVGPRPERPCFVVEFADLIDNYVERFKVKPGITGSAQIYNGYDTCLDDVKNKLQYELDYIAKESILLDLKLIFLTVISMLKGEGDS
ncbi:sugar transferase [candidate division KSB1 bacterium]|nr:sugar transferase [candidate division KSB1 bacterium]